MMWDVETWSVDRLRDRLADERRYEHCVRERRPARPKVQRKPTIVQTVMTTIASRCNFRSRRKKLLYLRRNLAARVSASRANAISVLFADNRGASDTSRPSPIC